MIAIINIDEKPRPKGKHRYSLRINGHEVCQFDHNREEDLAACLRRAADATDKAKTRMYLEMCETFSIREK